MISGGREERNLNRDCQSRTSSLLNWPMTEAHQQGVQKGASIGEFLRALQHSRPKPALSHVVASPRSTTHTQTANPPAKNPHGHLNSPPPEDIDVGELPYYCALLQFTTHATPPCYPLALSLCLCGWGPGKNER